MDGGCYIAVFQLSVGQTIAVGQLGEIHFPEGMYFYVGSAQKDLSARIDRHGRPDKPLRWHVDYLSAKAWMLGAVAVAGGKKLECELAAELAEHLKLAAPGFGASDCRCRGHLFYSPDLA